jgi:lipid II:glycine glycyltransferase (peptidoglycan interpeptide bridge formation enzyme)
MTKLELTQKQIEFLENEFKNISQDIEKENQTFTTVEGIKTQLKRIEEQIELGNPQYQDIGGAMVFYGCMRNGNYIVDRFCVSMKND